MTAYRYTLTRDLGPGPAITFVMLNPSTAGQVADDATIRRVKGFAAREGAGLLIVVNLFAARCTDSRELARVEFPEGPGNDRCILACCQAAGTVIAAWGTHGALHGRAAHVTAMLTAAGIKLSCLGVTRGGHPRHPLYLPAAAALGPYPGGAQ